MKAKTPHLQSRLLATKLQPPPLRSVVLRPRLVERLNTALNHKLLLISAPAGFGKTTLATHWLSQLDTIFPNQLRYAWLSLDEHDNEPGRFLAYLITALQTIDAHIGRGLQDALHTQDAVDAESILTALLNDLIAADEDSSSEAETHPHIILVLDDYHALDNPDIDSAVAFLLDHLPPNLHLMMLSRIDPTLSLARLRARREMIEVRERDLRFTTDETERFLADIMALTLTEQDAGVLHARTEGWVAGLQLAGLALQEADTAFITTFSGTHRYVLDYLTDEVFGRQSPEIQRFLLETSILNRMCAPLCDAMLGADDSQTILERLEHNNLFVVPLDHERRWYRYHHLFADLLRQRLRQTMPEAIVTLNQRASDWYAVYAAETGEDAAVDEGVDHALAASDHQRLADLLTRFGDDLWERGRQDKLRGWLDMLPDAVLNPYPTLSIFKGWLAFATGQYTQAEACLSQAEYGLTEHSDASDLQELHGRIAAVRAFVATFKGDTEATVRHAEDALRLLAPQSTWRGGAGIALGDACTVSGETMAASEAYRAALTASQTAGNLYLTLNAGFKFAAVLRQRGLLRQAYDICSAQIALAEKSGLAQTAMAGCSYALRGDILCEWNQLSEALAQTAQAMDTVGQERHIGFAGWIRLYRTRCLLAARDFDGAEAALSSMDTLAQGKGLPPWLVSPLTASRVLVWLMKGERGRAINWVQETGLSPDDAAMSSRELEYLIYGRLLMLGGQFDDAQKVLMHLLDTTRQHQRNSICLVVLLSLTLLFQAHKNTVAAQESLAEALKIGEAGEFARSFLDGGKPLIPLLQAAETQGITPDYTRNLLKLLTADVPQAQSLDALSEREFEVLKLIADGLKNQAIADRLVISLNTVLYHTKNIYSKLNVTHRTQAVQRARELNLL